MKHFVFGVASQRQISLSTSPLRVASIKLMGPIFFAFDHPIYQCFVSTHLADLLCMPQQMLHYLENNGAFAVHITSHPGHATAMDETHETCINKTIKQVVTRPNPELMEHTSNAFPFRSECQDQIKQLEKQPNLFIEDRKGVKVADTNVTKMLHLIERKQVLDTTGTS